MSTRSIQRCHLARRLLALLGSEVTIDSGLSNSARSPFDRPQYHSHSVAATA